MGIPAGIITDGKARYFPQVGAALALAIGALIGATLISPDPAEAGCADTTAGKTRVCDDAFAGDTFAPTQEDWAYDLIAPPLTSDAAASSAVVTITNDDDLNGVFNMQAGTSIAVLAGGTGPGLNLTNANGAKDSTVTFNLDGTISSDVDAGIGGDGIRAQGFNMTINVGENDNSATITGRDDGIRYVAPSPLNTGLFKVVNKGTITGRGAITANDIGFGIEVNNGGAAPNFNLVDASVEVTNFKVIRGATTTSTSNLNNLGSAILVATTGTTTITNETGGLLEGGNRAVWVQQPTGGGAITVINKGTIHSFGGAAVDVATEGEILIKNLSTSTIVSDDNHGINAAGDAAGIVVFNGDGGVDNPDGLIRAFLNGINANTINGGNITVWNGNTSTTASKIFADGEYGMFARSRGDGTDDGDAQVNVHNFGLTQTNGVNADAVVYARATGDVDNSYVRVTNGALLLPDPAYNPLARLNGFYIDPTAIDPASTIVINDANGVELVKYYGTGGRLYDNPITESTRHAGTTLMNYGVWDFYAHPYGDYLADSSLGGGIYAPGGSAVLVRHFGNSDSYIYNAGTIIGQGSGDDPVLDIRTAYVVNGADGVPNRVFIVNDYIGDTYGRMAVMGSAALPDYFSFADVSASNLLNTDLTAFGQAAGDYLLEARGAPVTFYNGYDDLIAGRVDLRTGDDDDNGNLIENYGAWFTRGINRFFGGPNDQLWNEDSGVIQTAFRPDEEEETHFRGLNYFYNSGLLNMTDGAEGDYTRTTGDYQGGGSARLGVDAFLGAPGSRSDVFSIGGDSLGATMVGNGTTGILVNDTNAAAGFYNPTGILVVHVDGTTSGPEDFQQTSPTGNFYLPNGPIDKGFFTYDLYRVEESSVGWYLAGTPNERAFELPQLTTGLQTLWYESTGVWLDRTADLRRTAGCTVEMAPAVSPEPFKVGSDYDGRSYGAPCTQPRYGVWARGFGGDFSRDASNTTHLDYVINASHSINSDYDQDLWGIEGGFDAIVSKSDNSAFYLGFLGGFTQSKMDFKASGDNADIDGGMIGVYGTYVAGPWYADLLFKANFLNVDYKTTFVSESWNRASPDADSFGIRLDTGYRFNLSQGFFVDPQGTLAWVTTDTDNISLLNANARFNDGDSFRGRLGLRAGYSVGSSGGTIWEPFATASVWHEFEGDNQVSLTSGGYTLAFKDSIDDTWGEVGGGLNVFMGNTSVFVKADALVGGDLEGWNVKGGGRFAW